MLFKQFLICLKHNLREEDNFSTRDKWSFPEVSAVGKFYCNTKPLQKEVDHHLDLDDPDCNLDDLFRVKSTSSFYSVKLNSLHFHQDYR